MNKKSKKNNSFKQICAILDGMNDAEELKGKTLIEMVRKAINLTAEGNRDMLLKIKAEVPMDSYEAAVSNGLSMVSVLIALSGFVILLLTFDKKDPGNIRTAVIDLYSAYCLFISIRIILSILKQVKKNYKWSQYIRIVIDEMLDDKTEIETGTILQHDEEFSVSSKHHFGREMNSISIEWTNKN